MNPTINKYLSLFNVSVSLHFVVAFFVYFPYSYIYIGERKMKILASDFDNTLFFRDGVHKQDVEAIRTFQKQGHLFGLCTGRQLEGIKYPFGGNRDYPLTDIDFDFSKSTMN